MDLYTPRYKQIDCDHITIEYDNPSEELEDKYKNAPLEVIGYQSGVGVDCLVVSVNGSIYRPDGGIFHITLSIKGGHKPLESNALLKQQGYNTLIPFPIQAEAQMLPKYGNKIAVRARTPEGFKLGIIPLGGGDYDIFIANDAYFEGYRGHNRDEYKEDYGGEKGQQLAKGHLCKEGNYYCMHTRAEHGYGPTLYDIGMIVATKNGSSLIPSALANDAWGTSKAAQAVWEYYYKNRGDVVKTPLSKEFLDKVGWNRLKYLANYGMSKERTPWLFYSYQLTKKLTKLGPVWEGSKI